MRIDETIYNEYAGWQLENDEVLKDLKIKGDSLFYRFKHVFDVVDYLYLQLVENPKYSETEDQIFRTGYYYLVKIIDEIKDIVEKYYNNNFDLANNFAKDINFLLNIQDFQAEIILSEKEDDKSIKELLSFDQKVVNYLEKKQLVPENIYQEFDSLLSKVFDEETINYLTINSIFLEIADELNIL